MCAKKEEKIGKIPIIPGSKAFKLQRYSKCYERFSCTKLLIITFCLSIDNNSIRLCKLLRQSEINCKKAIIFVICLIIKVIKEFECTTRKILINKKMIIKRNIE